MDNNDQQMQATEAFAGQVITDMAAAISGVMTNIGHKLGLYKAMAKAGALSSAEVAQRAACHERYVREWLNNQTAGGYVLYDKAHNTYMLPDAHIPVLVDENSPMFLIPATEVTASLWHDEDKLLSIFSSGEGLAWGDHHHRLFCGSESLFRPGYKSFLIADWIAAIPGLAEKLKAGAKIADVGCGHGASTILMATAYEKSTVIGFDVHSESVTVSRQRAVEENAGENLEFKVAAAKSYTDKGFDLICFMDCLHDMGDPEGAAQHALKALNPNGVVMLVEPAAADCVSENINPVSRLYYAASTAVCTPCSLSQEVKTGLGAQAGPKRLSTIMKNAGFSSVEKVAETPFNIILAARP